MRYHLRPTHEDIMKAPAFTIFMGAPPMPKPPRRYWEIFGVDGNHDEVVEHLLEQLGVNYIIEEPERCDDGAPGSFTDDDAILAALQAGYKLIKVPDKIGSQYFRLLVVEGV